ncbi:hypothetical protein ACI3ET_01205 [Ornithinimicrobium sp. LYQ121]|uniref:hypothetical protein n=1 Tax=Ornithinimicrobium sp. LYQ121 TaxID=3378801 RepID=UPI003851FEF3
MAGTRVVYAMRECPMPADLEPFEDLCFDVEDALNLVVGGDDTEALRLIHSAWDKVEVANLSAEQRTELLARLSVMLDELRRAPIHRFRDEGQTASVWYRPNGFHM